ncbi:hypothetical protein MTR67_011587 [Solanum verrucosum]|uniref:Uncharacterized protein n=1 Tax=Solanum verrucosum TaxID=315347 RepID=A0AAF0TF92_SOLVR|nr:hypothetical protein MTR67_011587 [Solanum verrucosum]
MCATLHLSLWVERLFRSTVGNPPLSGLGTGNLSQLTQVPSEGEFATGKRMDQGISEPEGSRKKKKKQVATPHPTCYLVHFSCGFIKKHSATTHPESLGLKAHVSKSTSLFRPTEMEADGS